MQREPAKFIDVDGAEPTLARIAAYYGYPLPQPLQASAVGEVRLDCPADCYPGCEGRKDIAINVRANHLPGFCHKYGCHVRLNRMKIMYLLKHRRPPPERLRGDEFNEVKSDLAKILAGESESVQQADAECPPKKETPAEEKPKRNIPLAESENEKARDLVTLDEKFVVEPAAMSAKASAYVRRHHCLTPEAMKKWRIGVLPADGGGDKRGFSLRNCVIYPMLSEKNRLLGWAGRDPAFEEKLSNWQRGDRSTRAPVKYRFPRGFHRGLELFGQQSDRLQEPNYRQQIAQLGIIVVEGCNDVLALDNRGVPAVAICSNRITTEQVAKVARWARLLAGGKVVVLFDCDVEGDEGAKDALWKLAEQGLDARLGWSTGMYGREFAGMEPERLNDQQWEAVRDAFLRKA